MDDEMKQAMKESRESYQKYLKKKEKEKFERMAAAQKKQQNGIKQTYQYEVINGGGKSELYVELYRVNQTSSTEIPTCKLTMIDNQAEFDIAIKQLFSKMANQSDPDFYTVMPILTQFDPTNRSESALMTLYKRYNLLCQKTPPKEDFISFFTNTQDNTNTQDQHQPNFKQYTNRK
jgi:hypothetical protein